MAERIGARGEWVYGWDAERGRAEVLRDRVVLVEGERIAAILPGAWRADGSARELGGPGTLVVPGLINAHVHSAVTPLLRGVAEDDDRDLTLHGLVVPVLETAFADLAADEIAALLEWGQLELLRSGVTTVVENALHDPEILVEATRRTGLRGYLSLIFSDATPPGRHHVLWGAEGDGPRALRLAVDLHRRHDGAAGGRLRILLGPHAPDTCGRPLLAAVRRAADELGCPVMIHLNQTARERETVAVREGGASPVAYLDAMGLLRPGLLAAHNTHVTAEDAARMAQTGVTAVYLPYVIGRRGHRSPLPLLQEAGVAVALGTDTYSGDFVSLMKLGAYLGKQATGRPGAPTARALLDAATDGAARGLRRPDLGRIAPGALADLCLVDLGRTTNAPVFDPVKSLVYYSAGPDVRDVLVGGQPVVEAGRVLTMDADRARARAQAACARVWEAVLQRHRAAAPGA